MDRGVPLCFLKLIVYWYSNMKSRVRWESSYSNYFDVLSGIKQGGVLSPRIFIIYVNDLIVRLRTAGVGCHLFSLFVACIMYADDLCLIAPLVEQCSSCSTYAKFSVMNPVSPLM